MNVFRVEVLPDPTRSSGDATLLASLRAAGLPSLESASVSRLFLLEGALSRADADAIARDVLTDPICERYVVCTADDPEPTESSGLALEIHLRPGVMDPPAETTLAELRAAGYAVAQVRTARRYILRGGVGAASVLDAARRRLANEVIEQIVIGAAPIAPSVAPRRVPFAVRTVSIRSLDEAGLERLSRDGHLFLSRDEMQAIQSHFQAAGRDPTDLELETLAQTWSEHCVHKTLKSAVAYRGAPMPRQPTGARDDEPETELHFQNLLKDTVARATRELIAEGRGPTCLSVFDDNAGVIAFDERFGVAFKVETHNRPSAIEPYGGAATGVGGCIRDVLGCGLGAEPIANTDVFMVAPGDWSEASVPRGALHPERVLRGVVRGVADYGNRMGIPTVNGAVYFDPRYLGNPLVFCGCVGMIPRDHIRKTVRVGDRIVLIGGRTGRDGIHGATFSSAELTDTHAGEFAHAVQIGNAITEKRVLDAVLAARDDAGGCLFSAMTDCGAGGLSSAIGEMGREVGARVDLDPTPLKYAGLRYDEIWISEAQERMVLAVPPERLERLVALMREHGVEATDLGEFGTGTTPRLIVRYQQEVVGDLDMAFVHDGWPRTTRAARWRSRTRPAQRRLDDAPTAEALLEALRDPSAASKSWIVRQYDHEVQGRSVVKPFAGRGQGPSDAAVLRGRYGSARGVALGCGFAPWLSGFDPYWAAAAGIDEALRNVVSVGGDPRQTAILDNFCWPRTDDPEHLGGLVRACCGCYDVARAYGTPFISGKDSLNNEFALDASDVERVVAELERHARRGPSPWDNGELRQVVERIRRTRRLAIPGTLLISAVAIVEDVSRCVTSDLKPDGGSIWLVGGLPETGYAFFEALRTHQVIADAIRSGRVAACHDVSDGGWLAAVAEMAIGGGLGADVSPEAGAPLAPLERAAAAYVVQCRGDADADDAFASRGVTARRLGALNGTPWLRLNDCEIALDAMRQAWQG